MYLEVNNQAFNIELTSYRHFEFVYNSRD